ncbi:MAG: DNA translocase FtsK [Clostridia bacterium]|nr:DNA translocase FtsK [Clostridia bacterium]
MSSTTASKKQKTQALPAPATTGRGAALYIALGIFLLTLGTAWLLPFLGVQEGYVINQLFLMLQGLCGSLCPGMVFLCFWAGAGLLVACRHRVSVRNFFIVLCLYLLTLGAFTLIARVPGSMGASPYLDFMRRQAEALSPMGQSDFNTCLNLAYAQRTSGAGGLLGMLIAYPLSHLITRIGAEILVIVLMLILLCTLFRLHPGRWFRTMSEKEEKRRAIREQMRQEQAAQQGQPPMPEYVSQSMDDQPEMGTPPAYYSPAPMYAPQPVISPKQDENGFYAVQPDLYQERFSEAEPEKKPIPEPDWRKEPAREETVEDTKEQGAPEQEKPNMFGSFLNRLKTAKPEKKATEPVPAAQPAAAETKEEPEDVPPHRSQPVIPPARTSPRSMQALDDDDDLPWDIPSGAVPHASPAPVKAAVTSIPSKKGKTAANRAEQEAPKRASSDAVPSSAPAPAPAASWASQVIQKQKELDMPVHTTRKNEPKPVYTDPVMPITGERISIAPKAQPGSDAKLDGTSAPKLKETSMADSIPYSPPPIRLLKESRHVAQADAAQEDERRANIIEGTLRSFGVESEVKQIMHGPSITRFAIQIAPGVKVSRVANTSDNLALELKTKHVRVEAPIQGTNYIGIEVPNLLVSTVALREVLDSPEMRNNPSPLLVALGKDIAGSPVLCDLSKMPHLLIAGATGSGKSVCINSIVCSLLYRTSPDQVRLIMIDPKQVELSVYNTIPHLLVPVISDPKKAAGALAWVVQEMLERYGKFSAQGVRNIAGYNKANQGTEKVLPNIVVIIDEMADLMEVCRKDVEESIRRLAALARAAGIYMVLATQRPSVDVITGVIKNNIPSRIAFAVSSGTDSRTIIDINGAEKLMGKGDMLYKPAGASAQRVQGCLVTDDEVNAIAEYIGARYQTDFDPNIVDHLENTGNDRDADEVTAGSDDMGGGTAGGEGSFQDLLQQAIEMAVEDGSTSTSMLQRRLRVGYARAGRLIDEMEKRGIISQSEGSKPRKTIITREQYYELMGNET